MRWKRPRLCPCICLACARVTPFHSSYCPLTVDPKWLFSCFSMSLLPVCIMLLHASMSLPIPHGPQAPPVSPLVPNFPFPMSPKIRPYMVVFLHEGMLPGMPPCPSLIPPGPKSPACPLKVDPKWLFFPHKGMFRFYLGASESFLWAQVTGRMKARYPPAWVSLGPRCQNPWQRTRQKASRVDRAWAPMETVEAWEQVPLRSWQNLLGRIFFSSS